MPIFSPKKLFIILKGVNDYESFFSFYEDLKKNMVVTWDDRGNIGKRYFAQDEIGTPWCVTVDFDTEKNISVTVRDRDTGKQERIEISKLQEYFSKPYQ